MGAIELAIPKLRTGSCFPDWLRSMNGSSVALEIAEQVGQVVWYVRVSSDDQNPARQVAALGEDVQRIFEDRTSGGTRVRPALDDLLK